MNTFQNSVQELQPTIVYCLDHDLTSTAEFTAERLIAQDPDTPESAFLYSLVLYKEDRFKAAYNASSLYCTTDVNCSYVFAKACLHLDRKPDGISALTKTLPLWSDIKQGTISRYEPDQVACYMLLAKLYGKVGDSHRCALNYAHVLKLNPYMFEAFEELCRMGAKVKVNSLYKQANPVADIRSNLFHSNIHTSNSHKNKPSEVIDEKDHNIKKDDSNLFKTPVVHSKESMHISDLLSTPDSKHVNGPPNFLLASPRPVESKKRERKVASSITSRLLNHSFAGLSNSANIMSGNAPATSSPTESRKSSVKFENSLGGTDKYVTEGKVDNILKNMNNDYLASIYSKLAKGYRAMCMYDCFHAIRIFNSLPDTERNTPWILAKLGRLHFEIVNYEEAEKFYVQLRKIDRTRVKDMDVYSTLLWHLQKEIDLSFLCHEMYEVNKNAPETWICIGNLYSLHREPDEAIKCFQKATKLDNNFAYAYTLQGHEYLANDAFENAMECFRRAIALDRRHYNAFYGIGMVYLKLGDFLKAEFHFRKAADINPVNVILICCIGMVLEKLDKREKALQQYIFASKLQPLSMLALFKKAQALLGLKQYELALTDFRKLENMAPDEASVHFLLGKLYKFYGKKNDAVKEFTTALNLDPKGSHLIKEALENRD